MSDTIAVVFDFDDTLAPDSTSSFLASLGIDVPAFWKRGVQPLVDEGWDPICSGQVFSDTSIGDLAADLRSYTLGGR